MSMAIIAGVATVAGVATTVISTANQANNSEEQIAAQQGISEDQYSQNLSLQEEFSKYLEDAISSFTSGSTSIVNDTYSNISSILTGLNESVGNINIPGVLDFMSEAESLSLQDFNYRDAIQKENLAFALGDTEAQLREAQSLNASLAALDSSAFQGKMGDIFKSSIYGLKATTVGEASGSFANLSAENLFNFSQQGLSNHLAISDFFSSNGTVDPISPLQTAFDLQNVKSTEEFNKAQLNLSLGQLAIGAEEWAGSSLLNILGTELSAKSGLASSNLSFGSSNVNTLANNLIGVSNSTIAADAAEAAGYTQAASQLISGITSYGATQNMNKSTTLQNDYYKAQIANINSSKFAA